MAKKTWNEKLNDSKNMPCVENLAGTNCQFAAKFGPRMLLAPPLAYDALMKQVPKGKVLTIDRMRTHLSNKHNADWTCFMTAAIFCNIAARASVERKGVNETPYWRTLKKDGELNEKYPDGIDGQKLLLEMEGHTIRQKGKRYFVENFESKLHEIKDTK